MTLIKLVAIAAATLIVSVLAVDPASAQRRGGRTEMGNLQTPGAQRQATDREAIQNRDHLLDTLGERRPTDRRGRHPSPEQVAERAQAAAVTAGLSCQVNESALLGTTNDNDELYEVACAGGAGYILTTATPPQTFDCLMLAAQAEQTRAQGGEVAANSVCALPVNQNGAAVVASFAREAGVPCQVDAGKALGATPEGNPVYEVGCAGADGYHIEKTAQGWRKTDCLQIIGMNLTCQFTTSEEQAAGFNPLLVGTAIDDCVAQQIQLLAQNDTGRFIEVKCTSGDGYVAQVKDGAVNQVYPCDRAQRIGGGCTLTRVAAPEAAARQ